MTIYTKKVEYVKTDWSKAKTIKPSIVKKMKLENQGYTLVKSWYQYPDFWISMYIYEKREIA